MTPAPDSDSGLGSDGAEIRVVLARFEAKLDVALAQHGAKLDQHDHELRNLRESAKEETARRESEDEKLEVRVSILERTPTVSPKALWAAFASAVGVLAALSPLIARIYG